MHVEYFVQEVEMKYLLLGLIVTLLMTTFMLASKTSAVYGELKEWVVKGRSRRLS